MRTWFENTLFLLYIMLVTVFVAAGLGLAIGAAIKAFRWAAFS